MAPIITLSQSPKLGAALQASQLLTSQDPLLPHELLKPTGHPQGLCTGCLLYLDALAPDTRMACPSLPSRVLRCLLLGEAHPHSWENDNSSSTSTPSPLDTCTLLPFFLKALDTSDMLMMYLFVIPMDRLLSVFPCEGEKAYKAWFVFLVCRFISEPGMWRGFGKDA